MSEMTKEEALEIIHYKPEEFKNLPAKFKKDREIVLAAVNSWEGNLEYADDSLKKDREFVLAAVQSNGLALQYADDSLKKDREIVLAAVQSSGFAFEYAGESLKKDKEIILSAIDQRLSDYSDFDDEGGKYIFHNIDKSLWKDEDICIAALKYDAVTAIERKLIDKSFLKDKSFIIKCSDLGLTEVETGYEIAVLVYHIADPVVKKDRDIVLKILEKNISLTFYDLDSELLNDEEIILKIIDHYEKHGIEIHFDYLKKKNPDIFKNWSISFSIVKISYWNLMFIDTTYMQNEHIIKEAVKGCISEENNSSKFTEKDINKIVEDVSKTDYFDENDHGLAAEIIDTIKYCVKNHDL